MNVFAIVLMLIIPHDNVVRESCDTIELNNFYDDGGRLVFRQLLFIDVDASGTESVIDWRMVKDESHQVKRDWDRGGFYATFMDGSEVLRTIRTRSYRETWSQYDPELLARESLPQEKRRKLKK